MKNKGFTLIEIILALGILVMTLGIISNLQIKSIFRVLNTRQEIDRIFLVQTDLINYSLNLKEKNKPLVTDLENINTKIKTEIFDIDKKSELRDFIKDIKIVKSTATWQEYKNKKELSLINLVYLPEKDEQEKKK